jgi:DNA-directed RNA polymerase sigma subunit (sigma70/sigma32)
VDGRPPDDIHAFRAFLRQECEHLPTIDRQIAQMRFGLIDGFAHDLPEVQQTLKVTVEEIRKVEAGLVRKWRRR